MAETRSVWIRAERRLGRIWAFVERRFDAIAARPSRVTFVVGFVLLLVFFIDGRREFWILGGILLLLVLAPPRLRKVTATGFFSIEFRERLANEIVGRTRRSQIDGQDAAVVEASVRAAARALSEAATPELFARQLSDFLDMTWRDAPTIEGVPQTPAGPADAEYRARYYGESAFLHLGRGQTGQLAVAYQNIGTRGWQAGTRSQADLVIPPGSPDNSTFAAGWLSRDRYASQSVAYVAPGQIGYFVYNVRVPDDAPLGVYQFRFRPENQMGVLADDGGYQDIKVVG